MKRFLMTTAITTMAMTGAASAQSLLERVLTDLGSVTPTGIFANTADNVLAGAVPDVTNIGGTSTTEDRTVKAGDILQVTDFNGTVTVEVGPDGTLIEPGSVSESSPNGTAVQFATSSTTTASGSVVIGAAVLRNNTGELTVNPSALSGGASALDSASLAAFSPATITTTIGGDTFSTSGINASVTNVLRGLDSPSAQSGITSATAAVDALIGNISTTGLGAVNTGDIQLLGANLALEEDVNQAVAGTSDAISQVVRNTVTQVGTATGETFLALNSALNETNINASVTNVMSGVNATIGRSGFEGSLTDTTFQNVATMNADAIAALTGGISTTALGAVNTGTIVSGAQQDVAGVITSIVGNAATNVGQ